MYVLDFRSETVKIDFAIVNQQVNRIGLKYFLNIIDFSSRENIWH